jgi:hypothetical protein
MEFKLTIRFKAEDEPQMAEFFQFIETNYPSQAIGGSADSEALHCHATIVLPTLADTIAAVTAFKAAFTITYKLEIG